MKKKKSSNSKKLTLEKINISRLGLVTVIGGNNYYSQDCGNAGGQSGAHPTCGGSMTQPTRQFPIFTQNGGH